LSYGFGFGDDGGGGGAGYVHEVSGLGAGSEGVLMEVEAGEDGGIFEELDGGGGLVGLGPTVLRAETAAVVAGTLLCALRAALVAPLA